MKYALRALAISASLFVLAACGQDRAALARQTVQTYWHDVDRGKMNDAYNMLSTGQQATMTKGQFAQNMFGLLRSNSGIAAKVGKVWVNGDTAAVAVTVFSPLSPKGRAAYQHLYWQNNSWKISEENGGLSLTR